MGLQLSFTEENVKKNPFDYPKLKLAKGETARLTVVENPWSEYVHNVQKPVLDEQNRVIYQTKDKKDGTQYQVPKLSFISNPICLGDKEVLAEKGTDPDNCPLCERAENGEAGFRPKRRFAMHVIRTNTAPGSFEANGTGGQLLIWAFTDLVFNKLVALQNEHGLSTNDLKLGPCEDATFQKADLNIANGTVVTEEQRAIFFAEKNRAEDPTVFCGSRKTKARIEEDLAQVDAAWAKSKGDDDDESLRSSESLSSGLDALLNEDKPAAGGAVDLTSNTSVASSAPEPVTSFEDLPASAPSTPAAEKKPDTTDNLDDILSGL